MRVKGTESLRGWKVLLAMFLFMVGFSVRAFAVPTVSNSDFNLVSYNSYGARVKVNVPDGLRAQAEVYKYDGTAVGNDFATTYSDASISASLKVNQVYLYRVRFYEHNWNNTTYQYEDTYGEWSGVKAFCLISPKLSLVNKKSSTVKVKIPKIKGVKNVVMSISTSQNKGFKKVATIKPGKSKKIAKFKGKKFQLYKRYYYKLKIKLKNNVSCEAYSNGFYLYRRWG